jgi:GNAT superfamily N-acetyltransferase
MSEPLALRPVSQVPDRAVFLDLVAASLAPCLAYVYDDAATAREALEIVFDSGGAEFCPPRGVVYVDDDGRTVAINVGMERHEQLRAGLQTALALRKSGFADRHPDVMKRLQGVATTLIRPGAGEYLWSQSAVSPHARTRGIGNWLAQASVDEARRRGCARVVGVMAQGSPAAGMFARQGFVEYERKRIEDAARGVAVEYIHLARELG